MRLQPGAPDLADSLDGAYVALAGAHLALFANHTRAQTASAPGRTIVLTLTGKTAG